MKIFLSSVDTYLQNYIYEAFCANDKEGKNEFYATRQYSPKSEEHFERILQFLNVYFFYFTILVSGLYFILFLVGRYGKFW